ncbi:unnamed protein product [Didymodactylos carnosus]|uniref:Uncharacterized protein n=1 Tax=Didymodactylos carnosus TaxID=1234261 RepID=A0A814DYU2_9BILA|nr:unnamed protein product [Didymodactylos carnosus]CAF0962308.1 unnamed protein product [Didymodactylos carnosus]CAF3648035.1 unnamed protein product [Didymodactylos carnosus]CAF3736731.1 unnamed protein product [Didymodactylos carnosus]
MIGQTRAQAVTSTIKAYLSLSNIIIKYIFGKYLTQSYANLRMKGELTSQECQLFEAAHYDKLNTLKRLIEILCTNINIRHPLGWTPLHVAVVNQNLESVKYLLLKGADPNLPGEYINANETAKSVWYLLKEQVQTAREEEFCDRLPSSSRFTTFKGFTCLHYAVLNGSLSIIRVLLDNNANPLLKTVEGHLPSAFASGKAGCKNLLLEYEEKERKLVEERIKSDRPKLSLEIRLKENIIGQNYAVSTVCGGKTELAKQIAHYSNNANNKNSQNSFIRVDMSEYQEKHAISKLIGSSPGYVGYQERGQLTESLIKCPTAVVLFDEVDKAHTDILTIMLQLFDEGRLTDNNGTTVDGKQAIYVMTSNLASEEIVQYTQELRQREEEEIKLKQQQQNLTSATSDDHNDHQQYITVSNQFKDKVVRPILKEHFRRDEFLGRINEIVYFLPFSKLEINKLLLKELEFWKQCAKEKHNIDIIWDRQALDCLAEAYDINYGARSIKHEIERSVVNQLASADEQDLIVSGNKVLLTTTTIEEADYLVHSAQQQQYPKIFNKIKLQKLEEITISATSSKRKRSSRDNNNNNNAIEYIDIKLDAHLREH